MKATPANLKSLRERMGVSVQQLATWLDVSDQTIYGWEKGTTKINPHAFELIVTEAGEHSRYVVRPEVAAKEQPVPKPKRKINVELEQVEDAPSPSSSLMDDLERLLAPHRKANGARQRAA